MKKLVTILLSVISFSAISQNCPYLGQNQILPCGVNTTTLTADLSQCQAGTNPNQTTNYTVSNIPYIAQTNTGTQLFMTDDSQQGPFNIGFNFCFFGTTYTQFYVGSNGWVSFSPAQPTTFTSQQIPTTNNLVPKNAIMGPWQDWHPGLGGQIRYQTSGVAPCRKLTISWIGVPMYSCTGNQGTFHIVIYESSNNIENYIQNKPACLQWQGGTSVEGVHDASGTIGIAVPGRNSTAWVANNDAWKWTPSGPVVTPTLTWYQVGNPVAIGTGATITVSPTTPTQYTCHFVYPTCNAGWSSCNQVSGLGPDTVLVVPGPPNIQVITSFTQPLCFNDCNGTATVAPITGTPQYSYLWSDSQTTQTATNLCSGVYSVLVTDINGCSTNAVVNISQPTQLIFDSLILSNVSCSLNDGEIYIYGSGGTPIYDYFVDGVQSNNDTIVNLSGGNYTVSIIDNNSCIVDSTVYIDFPTPINISILPIDTNLCVPGTFNFTNNSTPVANIVSSIVDYGDNTNDNILSNSNFIHTYNSVGTWNITITTLNDYGCIYTQTFNNIVETSPLPIAQFLVSPNPTTMFETSVTTQDYSLNAVSWNWNAPGSLEGSSNLQEPHFTFPEGVIANYLITLTVENSLGCLDSASMTLQVLSDVLAYIPNAFTPDGDELNSAWKFYLSGVDEQGFTMLVFNRWGQTIWECHDIHGYWDGSYNGYYVPDGCYVWISEFKVANSSEKRTMTGYVSILR